MKKTLLILIVTLFSGNKATAAADENTWHSAAHIDEIRAFCEALDGIQPDVHITEICTAVESGDMEPWQNYDDIQGTIHMWAEGNRATVMGAEALSNAVREILITSIYDGRSRWEDFTAAGAAA